MHHISSLRYWPPVPATEGTPLKKGLLPAYGAPDAKLRPLSISFAAMTLFSYTGGAALIYPVTFHVLGTVGGPLIMLCILTVSWVAAKWTAEAAIRTDAMSFGEIGFKLGGHPGWLLTAGSQLLSQAMVLPVSLTLCTRALQSLMREGFWGWEAPAYVNCNGNVVGLWCVIGVLLVQVSRRFEDVKLITCAESGMIVLTSIYLAVQVCISLPPVSHPAGAEPDELFVGVDHHQQRYEWDMVIAAIGNFVFTCLPCAILVELMSELPNEQRPRMRWVVDVTYATTAMIYLLAGLPPVIAWGGDLPSPITTVGIVIKVALISGYLTRFVLSSITLNKNIVSIYHPSFDYKWTCRNSVAWARFSLPLVSFAVAASLMIPRLATLARVTSSLASGTLQLTAIPLLIFLTSHAEIHQYEFRATAGGPCGCGFLATLCFGVCFSLATLASAVKGIPATHFAPVGNETFWCDLVG